MPLYLVPPLAFVLFSIAAWVYPGLLKPLWQLLLHAVYRFRVHGQANVPRTGPAIIVCNHVSYLDWMILWAACPRRATFVLWSGYYQNPVLRCFLGWARWNTIRIDNRGVRPHAMAESLRTIANALDAGRVIVMFPEGRLTRSGNMRPFGRGVEHVLKLTTRTVPVIPACTDNLWGSVFSHQGGRILWKWPRDFRRRLAVMFGKPIPHRTAADGKTAEPPPTPEIRLAIQETMAECALAEADRVPLVHRTFVRRAVKFRNLFRLCVIDHATGAERKLNSAKMFVASVCVARYLQTRVGENPNVGVWLPTSLGSALANLALAFLGKTSVNLNYTAGAEACRSAARQSNLMLVITSKKFVSRVPLELPDDIERLFLEDVMATVTSSQRILTMLMAILLPGWFIDRFVLGLHRHKLGDVLTIIFSSGSTGEPKGVVLTHRNIATNADSLARTVGIQPNDRLFAALPFFHSFGYTVCLWAPLISGAVGVYFPDPRQAKEVGEICKRNLVTIILSTATFLRFYLRRCGTDDFCTVRLLVCGAEKLPVKLQDEFEAKFAHRPLEGYGCTELSPVVSTNRPDSAATGVTQQNNMIGTVGQPIFGVCVKSFDPDTHEPLPPRVEGVLCCKGPNVMAGYLDQPERTAQVVVDGWYNTGDMGFIEDDGFIRITGRMSRFAKIGGEMVPLERLEEAMHDAFGGSGDRVLAVAAVPDEKRGERLVVLYQPDLDGKMASLLQAIRERGVPNLWVPDARDCYAVEALPLLGSGKLDLRGLSDLARQLSGSV